MKQQLQSFYVEQNLEKHYTVKVLINNEYIHCCIGYLKSNQTNWLSHQQPSQDRPWPNRPKIDPRFP